MEILQHGPDRRNIQGLVTAEDVVRVEIPASDQAGLMGLDGQFGNPKSIVPTQDGSVWVAPDTIK